MLDVAFFFVGVDNARYSTLRMADGASDIARSYVRLGPDFG